MVNIQFIRLSPSAILPSKAYPTDSGFDLYADLDADYVLPALNSALIPVGFSIQLENNNNFITEAQIRTKSGLALKDGLIVLNSPGTIDQDYSGEIKVILFNTKKTELVIKKNQKIAQLVVNIIPFVTIKEIIPSESNTITSRGSNGFGSTGINR